MKTIISLSTALSEAKKNALINKWETNTKSLVWATTPAEFAVLVEYLGFEGDDAVAEFEQEYGYTFEQLKGKKFSTGQGSRVYFSK